MARRTHQQNIVRNYYKNRNEIMLQQLGEIVSELWLAPNEFKRRRLWQRAEKALANMGVKKDEIARIVSSRDEKTLAAFLNRKF